VPRINFANIFFFAKLRSHNFFKIPNFIPDTRNWFSIILDRKIRICCERSRKTKDFTCNFQERINCRSFWWV